MKPTPNQELALSGILLAVGVGVGLFLAFRQPSAPPVPAPAVLAPTNAPPSVANRAEAAVPKGPPFTPWMGAEPFSSHLKEHEASGFWKENWVSAAEGRLSEGLHQYRVAVEPRPQGTAYWWYWWYDMSEEFYRERAADLRAKGFEEVYHQSYVAEDGQPRHQGVWHKVAP